MSLDNQRNLRLAFGMDPRFLARGRRRRGRDERMGRGVPRPPDRRRLAGAARVHDAHLPGTRPPPRRPARPARATVPGSPPRSSTSSCTSSRTPATLRAEGRSVVLYLPKIQVAAEAAVWAQLLDALEAHLGLPPGTIRVYVLVEQLEAAFQLLEIRAALGRHFVGFNTGRWDYINSVSDALHGDPAFTNPNIDAITMTYAYMRAYEDRVRRAVNTPDAGGRFALWQGGMEAQIPVGSPAGVETAMGKAVAGAEREQREGASGKWVAHWKMVHIVRPVWERAGEDNQLGRAFPPLTHTPEDAAALVALEPAPRTVRGARDLLSVGLQYGNAFLRGFQAAALKPADCVRRRRRPVPDGGHGDRRDPAVDPVGVAPQGRAVHGRRSRDGDRGGRRAHARAVRAPARGGAREAPRGRRARRPRRLEAHDAARSPARSSRATSGPRPSRPGTSTCSTAASATTTSRVAPRADRRLRGRASPGDGTRLTANPDFDR